MFTRRTFLELVAAAQAASLLPATEAMARTADAPSKLSFGAPAPFDFDTLQAMVADLAAKPYAPPPMPDPAVVQTMNFDTAKHIIPDPDYALFGDGRGPYPISLLAVGQLFPKTVRMFCLEDGNAREILFRPEYFKSPEGGPLARLPATPAPFAGLEFNQAYDKPTLRGHEGWARFLGASYFRAVGEANQFGLSARAIAQNSGIAIPEEFPDFTHFWVAEGETDDDPVTLYALLDGPSLVGAYRFVMHRGRGTTMEITMRVHLRKDMERLGIAPMTSMYWYSESVKGAATDWRPEIHDSDGLAMWTGKGEHLWRPLENGDKLSITKFEDESPRGFGLMQRDKNYDHYLDAVFYEKRPCGWIEPIGDWGKGSVQLLEIPTDNEIYDNVVLSWIADKPTKAGDVLDYRYRMLWRDTDPFPGDLAICVATRLGAGGVQGAPRSKVLRKVILEFKGVFATALTADATPNAVLSATPRGKFKNVIVEPSPDGELSLWRIQFDVDPEGADPVDLRCHLAFDGKPLTETWVYRYVPFESPVR